MIADNDNEECCLPIARRSLIDRRSFTTAYQLGSDVESSPSHRRLPRVSLNNSLSTDSGIDEHLPTPTQLIALYEKTIELAAKNKININNAFQISFVERLPEVLNIIAFDDTVSTSHCHEPNFIKVGSIIDTSAKIYGLRVDALHHDTQKLSGSIQPFEESTEEDSYVPKTRKKSSQYGKPKSNSYVVSDLTTISLACELDFHPLQPSHMCQWPGGIGSESVYADMVSYTMYSSSDFPLIKGFIDLNSRMNMEYVDFDAILDGAARFMCDLVPLREVIRDGEGENHVLGGQVLREFTFNEEPTVSYIETIDECSLMDSLSDDDDLNILSDLRDEPTSFHFQDLQSTYTAPITMPSMDMTLLQSRTSFVDQVPYLLRDKTAPSDYTYFDADKLKLFAGPYVWKYTNLLPDVAKPSHPTSRNTSTVQNRLTNVQSHSSHRTTRNFRVNLFNHEGQGSLTDMISLNPRSKSIVKKRKPAMLLSAPKHKHQLRLTRRARPLTELVRSNNIPELIFDDNPQSLSIASDEEPVYDDDHPPNCYDQPMEYDFIRPVHYDRIECDRNFSQVDTKKLQCQLADEYSTECSKTSSSSITLSTLCANLMSKNLLSIEKNQLISAFYCMLNNCNRKSLFMKNNLQQDDVVIQQQPFTSSIRVSYTHTLF